MGVASLILCGFVVMMTYWLFDSQCTSIQREIGKAEKEFDALESECVRETARWDRMKTPEKLAECLVRFGLEMKMQRQDQIVRMNRDGRPEPNQIAVARARSRVRAIENMAYKSSSVMPVRALAPLRANGAKGRSTTRR